VTLDLPAWSEPFVGPARSRLERTPPWGRIDRDWAFGDRSGRGITVAVLDSGIERGHPAVGGRVGRSMSVLLEQGEPRCVEAPDEGDLVGHGTACAGIIHALAPEAELISVRVLGAENRGKGSVFAAGLDWAIDSGASVVNLSLSSRSEEFHGVLHELVDRAYFANVLFVCAANNVPGPSYPSLFSSVASVAAHDISDPDVWFYNPSPPVEFAAYGVDVDVAWRGGGRLVVTGNSFAAPHIAGLAARIRSAHPGATPFETKAILAGTADNAR
jgi:subtilisin family serine protease